MSRSCHEVSLMAFKVINWLKRLLLQCPKRTLPILVGDMNAHPGFCQTAGGLEVPVSEHNKPEVKEAKLKEIQNLECYEMFDLVEYVGQECWEVGG